MSGQGRHVINHHPTVVVEVLVRQLGFLCWPGDFLSLVFLCAWSYFLDFYGFSRRFSDSYGHSVLVEQKVAHEDFKAAVLLLHLLMVTAALISGPTAQTLTHQLENFIEPAQLSLLEVNHVFAYELEVFELLFRRPVT